MWLLITSIVVFLFMCGLYGAANRRANRYLNYGIAQDTAIRLLRKTLKSERGTAAARLLAADDAYKLSEERRVGAGRAIQKLTGENVAAARKLSDAQGRIAGLQVERDELFDGQTEARALTIRVHNMLLHSREVPVPVEGWALISRAIKAIEAERGDW